MTAPTAPAEPPPAEVPADAEDDFSVTEAALLAAVAAVATSWLAASAAAILAAPGMPALNLLSRADEFVAELTARIRTALTEAWGRLAEAGDDDLRPYIDGYLVGLPGRLEGVGKHAWKRIEHALNDARTRNADMAEVRARVRAALTFADPDAGWPGWAANIADTEALISVSAARYAAAEQAAAAGATVTKQWRTRRDTRVRRAHADVEGITLPLRSAFQVGGWPMQRPGDPTAPAELVCRCRCRLKFRITRRPR